MNTETPNYPFPCADCASLIHKPEGTCAAGYAVLRDGARICYSCADKRQVADLLDRSRPFCGYVSGDGNRITSWTGGLLMHITDSRPCQLTRQSFTHDRRSYRSFRARDVHGKNWHGRGSAGIVIKLRPCK